jgi:glycerol kinase
MPPSHLLALDQGTTSSRAIVFNDQGQPVSIAQETFGQSYPQSGWVEHDPIEIWQTQRRVAVEALRKSGLQAADIAAIGITNQRETTVVWERASGQPIHPAIVWQDRRTAAQCQKLKEDGLESEVRAKTGLLLDPYFSGTKLAWILDNVPDARDRAEKGELCFGTIDTWLLWNLTGGALHMTDVTNASRTLLMNIHSGQWDPSLLQMLRIPSSLLPSIVPSSGIVGTVTAIPELNGIRIGGIAGDQHAALFGQTCFEPGMVKNTYGTGCFLLMHTGQVAIPSSNNLLTTVAWKIGDQPIEYAIEGSVFVGGAVVQWLRDEMGLITSAAECDTVAASVGDTGGLFIVPAFAGLGAPHWDPLARGIAIGITRGTNRAHFCRAALESIGYQSADLIRAMENDTGLRLRELRVDGGASRSDLLMQFQADLLDVSVARPACIETTALGAAYLAGLATGVWPDRAAIGNNWQAAQTFLPGADHLRANQSYALWHKALARARDWIQS